MPNIFKQRLIQMLQQRGLTFTEQEDPNIILLNRITILLGDLSKYTLREGVMSAVDQLLEKVLVLRKGFNPAQASDIYMLMVGPEISNQQSDWQEIVSEIERDDRLARKHVWLPSAKVNGDYTDSFESFIQTTFLATPWANISGHASALSLLEKDIGLPTGWENILLNYDIGSTELISELMQIEASEHE